MMRKLFLSCFAFLVLMSTEALGQTISVAHVNTIELINAIPEKSQASERLATLSKNYKDELQVMQNEYNKKYSDFVTYQNTLAENIKVRRMQELTELEVRIQKFTEIAQKDLEEQERIMLEPLRQKVLNAIKIVGIEHKFTVVYDLADKAVVFVTPDAVDANPLVKRELGVR